MPFDHKKLMALWVVTGIAVGTKEKIGMRTAYCDASALMAEVIDTKSGFDEKGVPDFDRLEAENKVRFGSPRGRWNGE